MVLLGYFLLVMIGSMIWLHPFCLLLSFLCAYSYAILLKGKKAILFGWKVLLPLILLTALLNPLFNHQGITILAYFPSGNPLTLESVIRGVASAFMFGAVLCWFFCFHALITSDQIVCLFGRIAPAFSLLLSMILRFVPQFRLQMKRVRQAQRGIGKGERAETMKQRIRGAAAAFSILITWALEHGVETADLMRSRGYGLKGRSRFSLYPLTNRDRWLLICLGIVTIGLVWGGISGAFTIQYLPMIRWNEPTGSTFFFWALYGLTCIVPIAGHLWEGKKWKYIASIS